METNIKVGETAKVEGDQVSVVSIGKNITGDPIIHYAGKRSEGVCVPSLWVEWRDGIKRTRGSDEQ